MAEMTVKTPPFIEGSIPIVVPEQPPKIDLHQAFTAIGERMCLVRTLKGRCTGILIGEKKLLVPFHAIALTKVKDLPEGRGEYKIYSIEVEYQDTTYKAIHSIENLERACYYDTCVFQIGDDDFEPKTPLTYCMEAPKLGEKVYFGGYPITQEVPSFHKARVSSVEDAEDALSFQIDGAVLPGNSGGPVFIQRGKELLLIGMIFAEMASVDRGFVREKERVKERLPNARVIVHGVGILKVISHVVDAVFDNLATGIGKVISIRHVQGLSEEAPPPQAPSPFAIGGYPVIKTEWLPGKLATDPEYFEWYHRRVKGKPLCGEIIGKILRAKDQIDKGDEKKLRAYYESHILSSARNGYTPAQRATLEKWETLRNKILGAKPKAINTHKKRWRGLIEAYRPSLPEGIYPQLQEALQTLS